jgi:hypothetical protein
MIRAGRMNLPFGVRTENHVLYVRSATRTDINDSQQLGASVVYSSKKFRFEGMGIAGNLQVAPDDFRERGYSLYGTYAVNKKFELGISSLLTHAKADIETYAPKTRTANGVFVRAAPLDSLAILAESDFLLNKDEGEGSKGIASSLVVDWEPKQGVHVMAIGQHCKADFGDGESGAWTAGGAVQWFLAPRFDIRADAFDGVLDCTDGVTPSFLGLVQGHFYL